MCWGGQGPRQRKEKGPTNPRQLLCVSNVGFLCVTCGWHRTLHPEGSCTCSNALRSHLKILHNLEQGSLHFCFTLGPANCVASPVVLRCCDTRHYSYLLSFNSPDKSCEVGMIILALLLWKLKLREVKLFAQSYTAGIWTLTALSPKPTLFHLTCSQNILVLRHGFPHCFSLSLPQPCEVKVVIPIEEKWLSPSKSALEQDWWWGLSGQGSLKPGSTDPVSSRITPWKHVRSRAVRSLPASPPYLLISQWLMASVGHAQRWWMTQTMEVPWQHWVQTLPFLYGGTRGWEKGSNLP